MNNLHEIASGITFASFCREIVIVDETTIDFKPKHSFHGFSIEEDFRIQKTSKGLVLSDKGITRANIDREPEFKESEVAEDFINYFGAVEDFINYFGMVENDKVISYSVSPSRDVIQQIWHYLKGINVLYKIWPIFKDCFLSNNQTD